MNNRSITLRVTASEACERGEGNGIARKGAREWAMQCAYEPTYKPSNGNIANHLGEGS